MRKCNISQIWDKKPKNVEIGPEKTPKKQSDEIRRFFWLSDVFFWFPDEIRRKVFISQLQIPETFYNCPKETTRPEFIQQTQKSYN